MVWCSLHFINKQFIRKRKLFLPMLYEYNLDIVIEIIPYNLIICYILHIVNKMNLRLKLP